MTASRLGDRSVGSAVIRGGRRLREGNWWASVAGGALAFPVAVVPHELGHYGAYIAFGFPDPVLRCCSAGWSRAGEFTRLFRAGDIEAAAAIAEPWQEAVAAAAGPIVSYLMLIICVLAVRRFGPGPLSLVFAVGLVTPFRWTWAFPILSLMLRGTSLLGSGRTDRRGAHRNTPVLLHCTGPRLARAWILVPRESHPTRPEGADRRPHVGRVDPGWRPVGLVAGTPASFVKDRGERGACLDTQGLPRRSTVVVEANCGFWGGEGGVCRRGQAPGEGSAGMRGAFRRRGVASPLAPAGRSPGDSC